MNIKFWGVRGSIPTPSTPTFSTSRYGGNTTCMSVHAPGIIAIFDGGSGLRSLGLWLEPQMPVHATFFFSHLHWDHIQGFPFFRPGFVPGNTFDLYGPKLCLHSGASLMEEALSNQQRHYNFPVELRKMPASLKITDLDVGGRVELVGTESTLKISCGALNHPGGCFGYRIEEHRDGGVKTFVYTTDTEHFDEALPVDSKARARQRYSALRRAIHARRIRRPRRPVETRLGTFDVHPWDPRGRVGRRAPPAADASRPAARRLGRGAAGKRRAPRRHSRRNRSRRGLRGNVDRPVSVQPCEGSRHRNNEFR